MDFDPENPFQSDMDNSEEGNVAWYFITEDYFKPRRDFQITPSFLSLRNEASVLFHQFAATGTRDPVIPYLAMIYFDLYASVFVRDVPNSQGLAMGDNKHRTSPFLTSCFIIAWKMRKPVFSLPEFLIQYNLPYQLINKIESIEPVFDRWLKYRHLKYIPMPYQNVKCPVTSFCFLDYLIDLFTELSEDKAICLKNFATHKLYALQYDMRYTVFQPSIVAAAAIAFCVVKYYEFPIEDLLDACFNSGYFNTDKLKLAIEMIVPGFTVQIGMLISSDDDDNSESSGTLDRVRVLQKEKQQQTALSLNIVPPDRSPRSCEAPARITTMMFPDRRQGARADTGRVVMPTADRSQRSRADNRVDIEMLPPPNRIPTRLGLTPSELPPIKRVITIDQISRGAKGKGKLYPE